MSIFDFFPIITTLSEVVKGLQKKNEINLTKMNSNSKNYIILFPFILNKVRFNLVYPRLLHFCRVDLNTS